MKSVYASKLWVLSAALLLGPGGLWAVASETFTQEFWPGVTLVMPAGSVIEYDEEFDAYDITLPQGREVSLEKWRMPRTMWRYSTSQVAAAFRADGQSAKRFTMRARGQAITTRALFRTGWVYERMVRFSRKEFIEANTSCPRREWNSAAAREARAVVDSLRVR